MGLAGAQEFCKAVRGGTRQDEECMKSATGRALQGKGQGCDELFRLVGPSSCLSAEVESVHFELCSNLHNLATHYRLK